MPNIRHILIAIFATLALAACMPGATPQTGTAMPPDADRDVFLTLAASISDGGKPQAALAYLDDYLLRYPADPRALLLKAEALARSGDLGAAGTLYKSLLATTPEAMTGLARVAARQGHWREAVDLFARGYGYMPSNMALLNDYGYALLMTGEPEKAYSLLARAHQLTPDDPRIRANFLLAAQRSGHMDAVDEALAPLPAPERQRLRAFLLNGNSVSPTLLELQRDSASPRPPISGAEAGKALEGHSDAPDQ